MGGLAAMQRPGVLNANHPNEPDTDMAAAGRRLQAADGAALGGERFRRHFEALSRGLFVFGTLPYYLHLLDPVRGAADFDVDTVKARGLLAELTVRLPGHLVPRLVREEPGRPVGIPIAPARGRADHGRTT